MPQRQRIRAALALACAAALALLSALRAAASEIPVPRWLLFENYKDGEARRIEREVVPGLTYRFDVVATGPLTVHTAWVDLGRPDLALEVEHAHDRLWIREPVDAMARRLADPAARPALVINADFFNYAGYPVNLFVDEGTIWTAPWRGGEGETRSVMIRNSAGRVFFGTPLWSAALADLASTQRLPIEVINAAEGAAPDRVVAYTWPFGPMAPPPPEGGCRVVLQLERPEWLPNAPVPVQVKSVSAAAAEPAPLDRWTVVLLLPGPAPEWLRPGLRLALDALLTLDTTYGLGDESGARAEARPGLVESAVGGGPALVHRGRIIVEPARERERFPGGGFAGVNPRTAIGVLPDGKTLVAMVIDGRQKGRSVGASLEETARLMRDAGCAEAINLDGGGSSAMALFGEIMNFPSDLGGPRAVTNAVVVRRTAPAGPPARLEIEPRNVNLPPRGELALQARARDAAGEPVPLAGWKVTWRLEGEADSRLTPEGILRAGEEEETLRVRATATPATTSITLAPGAPPPSGEATLRVRAAAKIEALPAAFLLNEGEEAAYSLDAFTAEGGFFWDEPAFWEITAPPFLRLVPAERRLKAVGAGAGWMRARIGGLERRIPVAVDQFAEASAFSFDEPPPAAGAAWIQGANFNKDATALSLDTAEKKEGAAAWRLDYAMQRGGTTKIALPLDAALPGAPLALGLWVRGDGNGHWLRGELRDAQNEGFYLNFTEAKPGVDWKDGWRFLRATTVYPAPMSPHAQIPQPPLRLASLYIAQTSDDRKTSGSLCFDGLVALDLPETLKDKE